MTPAEWIEMLNSKVFLWTTEGRLRDFLAVNEYRARPHDVLIFDTQSLVDRHSDRIWLTPINTGATIFNAVPRGRDTFRRIWTFGLTSKREPAELAVDDGIFDASELVLRVERRQHGDTPFVVWTR